MSRCPIVASCFVFGTTLNAKLVAIVVVSPDFAEWCKTKSVEPVRDSQRTREVVLAAIKDVCALLLQWR